MFAHPQRGFVFLAMPKCGSTALEKSVRAPIRVGGPLKHLSAADFARHIEPLLEASGSPRATYEVVCLFREPIDWLHSWWRFRSRDGLLEHRSVERRRNYTGAVSFEEFVETYIEQSEAFARVDGVGQAHFVSGADGGLGVDRMFRYERFEEFVAYLSEKLGRTLEQPPRVNVSPDRAGELSDQVRRRAREHLAREYEIYESI